MTRAATRSCASAAGRWGSNWRTAVRTELRQAAPNQRTSDPVIDSNPPDTVGQMKGESNILFYIMLVHTFIRFCRKVLFFNARNFSVV